MLNSNKAKKHLLMFLTLLICFTISTTSSTFNKAIGEEQTNKSVEAAQQKDSQTSETMLMDAINAIKQQLNQLESRVSSLESKIVKINTPSEEKTTSTPAQKWIEFANSSISKAEEAKQLPVTETKTDQVTEENKVEKTVSVEAVEKENRVTEVEQNTKSIEEANPNEKIESSCPVSAQKTESQENQSASSSEFKFKISTEKVVNGNEEFGQLSIAGKAIIVFRNSLGGKTPFERANITAKKLESLISKGFNINNVKPEEKNGLYLVSYNDESIFTVDLESAKKANTTQANLALSWVNNIRTAMGLPKVSSLVIEAPNNSDDKSNKNYNRRYKRKRISTSDDYAIQQPLKQASRSFDRTFYNLDSDTDLDNPNTPESTPEVPNFKPHSVGGASWYGPGFNGRKASDGSRFNQNSLTAAHKTLPFGTIVKVTNLKNNKSCIVKITDRGPFIAGRIIDLSKGAAAKVGMLGSGIATVKLEVMKK